MQEFQGIVAGIGDAVTGTNLIPPEMDAALYDFIIGRPKCIIDGLEWNGSTLSPGTCVCNGYRGMLDEAVSLSENTYIYGKFELHGDTDDKFVIIGSNVALTSSTLGNDYVTIKRGSTQTVDRYDYISAAEYAEESLVATERLENGVTAEDQSVNDNSSHVANTRYVHNQIEEEINYGTTTVNLRTATRTIGSIVLTRKSNLVVASVTLTGESINTENIQFTVPQGYRPNKNVSFVMCIKYVDSWQNGPYMTFVLMELNTLGNASIKHDSTGNWVDTFWVDEYANYTIGYSLI